MTECTAPILYDLVLSKHLVQRFQPARSHKNAELQVEGRHGEC